MNSFLNIRVADIQAVHAQWSERGAQFLTPPKQQPTEMRSYVRDPDGYVIEVGQTTLLSCFRLLLMYCALAMVSTVSAEGRVLSAWSTRLVLMLTM